MAMTKKEREAFEELLTAAALRTTADVEPDLPVPGRGTRNEGFLPVGEHGDYPRVYRAVSDSNSHGVCEDPTARPITNRRGAEALYSTELLALRALRRAIEKRCATMLRRVDKMIEEASGSD